ncbi:MAG: hypothetical protein AAGD25_01185 [Cyanobacteria bacterium P01_F01_bin.150]
MNKKSGFSGLLSVNITCILVLPYYIGTNVLAIASDILWPNSFYYRVLLTITTAARQSRVAY